MTRRIFYFLLVQSFVYKVSSIYAPPTIQQYLHLMAVPQTIHQTTVPATHNPGTNQANYNHVSTNRSPPSQSRPSTGMPSFSALALPNLVSGLQQIPEQPKATDTKSANPSNIDANLLNNLAIALQLLIVSNILNAPPTDVSLKPELKDIRPYSDSAPCHQYEAAMPNSNYVGTSSFSEPNLVYNAKPTRNSMALMSPYEALGPSSPYSDPILSQYGSSNPRMDFQSPYSMMDKDSFSMNGLF